jgi:hypothetical protein
VVKINSIQHTVCALSLEEVIVKVPSLSLTLTLEHDFAINNSSRALSLALFSPCLNLLFHGKKRWLGLPKIAEFGGCAVGYQYWSFIRRGGKMLARNCHWNIA